MNLEQLKKNVGTFVQLEPIACRLNEHGFELPARNDDWAIQEVTKEVVRISNVATGHVVSLGPDHVHHFTSNAQRLPATQAYGFLTLHVQLFIQGVNVYLRPTKPGERLPPIAVTVQEKIVDLRYPADSGIQRQLEALGYKLLWCAESGVSRKIDLEGWELVLIPDREGVLTRFRIRTRPEDQVLIRRFATEQIVLTKEERIALTGIGAAAAMGIATATRAVTSKRLVEIGLVGYDADGHLVLTNTGRDMVDGLDKR